MIYSETIETVYSNLVGEPVYSEEDQDYRYLSPGFRATDEGDARLTEESELRILDQ